MRRTRTTAALASLALLLTVITALVAGLENDDLVFDHDSRVSSDSALEQDNRESFFHSIWNWFAFETDIFSHANKSSEFDKSTGTNSLVNNENRQKRETKEDNEISNDDSTYKSKKALYKDESSVKSKMSHNFQQGDDEDDLGSGEPDEEKDVEGSANNDVYNRRITTASTTTTTTTTTSTTTTTTESSIVEHSNSYEEKNIFRISMIIKEPYREEFQRREDETFQKFARNLTKTVEDILHQYLRKEHHVTLVKVDNAPDAFESYVHLDIRTMSNEAQVRDALEKHVNTYYSLGKFAVNPATFLLRAVLECQPGELACDVSRCILQTQRCDFKHDCEDGSDEADCKYPTCAPDDFRCNNGQCIKASLYCDNRPDCSDHSDETNCLTTCSSDEYRCLEGICISIDKRCNGYADCRNGDDEDSCDDSVNRVKNYSGCRADEFECSPGYCISSAALCNGRPDCPNGNDERNCSPPRHREPESNSLIIKVYPVDQIIKERSEVVFQCRDEGPLRARVRWSRADGRPLPPGSRVANGRLEIPNVQLDQTGSFVCEAEDHPYLPGNRVVAQLTVEKVDQTWFPQSNRMCSAHEATCSNEECIPKQYICDGKPDCSDGSDEVRCGHHGCEPNEFRCANKQCVSKVWRCDGDKDCSDGSDEENCSASPYNAPCNYGEFKCASNDQCIPKSYQCDHARDCIDGSDEIGCSPVYIVKPPPPMVILDPGDTFSLTCTAIGVPIPEINWRLNWGHIPQKCSTTSNNGTGTLDCPDIRVQDQGAYSCEGINVMGFVIAVPDTILVVKDKSVCPAGKFNSEATRPEECISCFCFGVATECSSANLFTYQIPTPIDRYKVVPVETIPRMRISPEANYSRSVPAESDGIFVQPLDNEINKNTIIYFGLPEQFTGNQLKSYGGYLHFHIRYNGNGINNDGPNVVISGNNLLLFHNGAPVLPNQDSRQKVRFMYGDWYKQSDRGAILASREDIMMVLANIDHILIKAQFENSPQFNISITNVMLDSAANTGTDLAAFVEECRCPSGYTGLSCENCAPGYTRRKSGQWLGQCYKHDTTVPEVCPPGFYGDPSRGIPCSPCPCPDPLNKYRRTCRLDIDNVSPICHCPVGYEGKRCEKCADGYQGYPMRGEECRPYDQCDRSGSISTAVDPYTGRCQCKEYATGPRCNQCKANTFYLAPTNQFGCISCFCMGVTNSCISSNWYRSEIRASFTNSVRGFTIIGSSDRDADPIRNGINLRPDANEIVFNDFPDRGAGDVYYWQLPHSFLGDKVTAYGGQLKYVVRYVPSPGGLTSRNSAADVELISANDITLLYYSREFPEPNSAKTFTVPLLEQYWQRSDGTKADREHLLMALADIDSIRIKATYTTHTSEAALSYVSMDIAEEFGTGNQRALEVEKCSCPPGYQGLSCEDCAVGYTRAIDGLYLGICEPCKCNGHSNQCDPENGICENCAHHTTGENCEQCESGFEGDATHGSPHDCQAKNGSDIPCLCNPLGSISNSCVNGQCYCKRFVEGVECNRCRPSTFGLSQNNPDGCNECFCSGVTNQCQESSLYIQQIPKFMDDRHGLILTDSSRREVISDGFKVNIPTNEIGYQFTTNDRNKRLFWSLPSEFIGNRVKSYGGSLTLTQHIIAQRNSICRKDQDVIIIGNGLTLYWTNPENITPESTLSYSVPIKETVWRHVTTSGLRAATRTDLMTVLANIDAILIRASYCDEMIETYISDITLDTAVERPFGTSPRATQVEACRCPLGYTGTSCESCAPGYYRNINDRSVSILGSCSPCPCNGHEQSCELDWSGQVRCHCHSQYTGHYCQDIADYTVAPTTEETTTAQSSAISIRIEEPTIKIVKIGDSIRYHCRAKSIYNNPVTVKWEKEGGYLPIGRGIDDSQGVLFIREVRVSDSGNYICRVTDGVHVRTEKVALFVGNSTAGPVVTVNPPYQTVVEGSPAEFQCETNAPSQSIVDWIRPDGRMNENATFSDGILRIPSVTLEDAAEYRCLVRSPTGSSEKSVQLHVRPTNPSPHPDITVLITPSKWSGYSGDIVRLSCSTSQPVQRIVWSRTDRLLLPTAATQNNGVLTISNPSLSDGGWYMCTATLYDGSEKTATTSVTIHPRHNMPIVSIDPQRQKVPQGSTATIQCKADGNESNVVWLKNRDTNLGSNVQALGNTLRITNIQVSNRGMYTCRYSLQQGNFEASAIVDVEPREMPVLQIHPKDSQEVIEGGTADFHCRAIAGIPSPDIKWSRQDNRPFGSNVEIIQGMLRINNVTNSDAGSYVCVAENTVGVTSATVTLDVHSYPKITISPQNGVLNLKSGDRLHLICSATGYPQPIVSWTKAYEDQPIIDPYKSNALSPSSTIEINSISREDEGTYVCRASSPAGTVEDYVQLRLEDDGNNIDYPCRGDTCEDPIVDETTSKNSGLLVDRLSDVPNGGRVSLRCHLIPFSDDKSIYLDWKRDDGRPMPRGSTVNEGILTIDSVRKEDSGYYTCYGVDAYGKQVFSAKTQLVVVDFPKVKLTPTKQTVRPGENPSIQCLATGEPPLSVEWEAVGRSLPSSVSQSKGQSMAVLQFYDISFADAGKYVCKAWNDLGTAESVAEVTVDASTTPIVRVQASKNPVSVGDSVELHCVTSGIPNPNYVWSRPYEISLPWNARESGNILSITDVTTANGGLYRCAIDYGYGVVEDDVNLHVQDDYMTTDETDDSSAEIKRVSFGKNIDLECRDRLQPPATYRWSKLNGSLPMRHQESNNVLSLIEVDNEAAGVYSCKASNDQETTETFTTVVVNGVVPYFSQSPLSFMELPPLSDVYLKFNIEISFKPKNLNGILLYTYSNSDNDRDFLSLALKDGYPEFIFDLGSGPTVVKADRNISLGQWHTIVIRRDRKEAFMIVDKVYSYSSTSKGKKDGLDVPNPLYVGGIPESIPVNENLGDYIGFVGCVNRLVVNGKQINLMTNMMTSQSITACEICESLEKPCNNGVCQESSADEGFDCLCNAGYTGKYCENVKQSCQPGICGEGMCMESDEGYVCDCPIGKTGSNCQYAQLVRTPKLTNPRSYLGYATPKSLRRRGH